MSWGLVLVAGFAGFSRAEAKDLLGLLPINSSCKTHQQNRKRIRRNKGGGGTHRLAGLEASVDARDEARDEARDDEATKDLHTKRLPNIIHSGTNLTSECSFSSFALFSRCECLALFAVQLYRRLKGERLFVRLLCLGP
jgi:hypothetical protein